MTPNVIITCAVTGAGDTVDKHPAIPVTPEQIATSALEAADAGAAIVHCHVRDPETGKGSRDVELYREVVERIRGKNTNVVINLTAGMGGDLEIGADETPMEFGPETDVVGPVERLLHVEELRPEICTLDCGTMNFSNGNDIYISTPGYLRTMAEQIKSWGVKPELEVFDLGHIRFARQMMEEGLIEAPALFQLCLGLTWGAGADTDTMKAMRDALPDGVNWASFGIARMQMPMAAQSVLLGGNVRVGLEDNIYLDRGVLASNGQLVQRAVEIVERLDARVLTPQEAREKLGLRKQA